MNPAMLSMAMPVLTKLLQGGSLGSEDAAALKPLTTQTPEDHVLAAITTLATYAPKEHADAYGKAVAQIIEGVAMLRILLAG